jgi:hypothetical protein
MNVTENDAMLPSQWPKKKQLANIFSNTSKHQNQNSEEGRRWLDPVHPSFHFTFTNNLFLKKYALENAAQNRSRFQKRLNDSPFFPLKFISHWAFQRLLHFYNILNLRAYVKLKNSLLRIDIY